VLRDESRSGILTQKPRRLRRMVTLAIECILIDCCDLQRMSAFWRSALNLEHVWTGPSGGYLLVDGLGATRIGLMPGSDEKSGKNRVHFDLRPDNQEAEIRRLEELGAARVDVGQRDAAWVVMADPEGNEFCVLRSR
jgi:predicted enzyme related to lactoylglutathione lyase